MVLIVPPAILRFPKGLVLHNLQLLKGKKMSNLSARRLLIRIVPIVASALTGCAAVAIAPTHPSLVDAALPELIPIRSFVYDSQRNWGHQISPDGKKMAWYSGAGGTAIRVKTLGTEDSKRYPGNPRYIRWAGDSKHLLLVADREGDENTRIHLVDTELDAVKPVDLTPTPNTVSHITQVVNGTSLVVFTSNRRDKKVFDLYSINLAIRSETLIARNPGNVARWVVDRTGALRARVSLKGDLSYLETPSSEASTGWKISAQWQRSETVNIFSVNEASDYAWAVSNKGRDKTAFVKIRLSDGTEEVVFSSPVVDLDWVRLSEKNQAAMHINVMPDYPKPEFFDNALKARLMPLTQGKPADIYVTSNDASETKLTVSIQTDKGSKSYLLDGENAPAELLGETGLSLLADSLANTQPISYLARDGLNIRGYLTLPVTGSNAENKPPKPLPLVLLVHGGPWVRDQWQFGAINRSLQQFLANRGYAVLQVNYRGSSGYGRAFMEKAIGEFAGKMHEDLLDAVQWAVNSGIADEKKVAIYGASYGGYAALVGATFTPDTFACAVGVVGVTDLARLLETAPPYWELGLAQWHRFVGNPANAEQRKVMDSKSPLYRAHLATKPILILHGENDVRVKLEQSDLMVEALRKAGKEVRYVILKGEGHANQKPASNQIMYREIEGFLASCLGGRASGS
jgi:dipeptidyl aminopeptidase/acylaminoacyl peptidase